MATDAPLYDPIGAVATLIQLREQSNPQLSLAEKIEAATKLIQTLFEALQQRGFRVSQPDPHQTQWLLAIGPSKQACIELAGFEILVGTVANNMKPVALNYDPVAKRFVGTTTASGREAASGPHGLADAIVDAIMGSVSSLGPPRLS
jgi:hypothetical protein